MKFIFSFQKLLEHKATLENIARREWAEAQAKVDEAIETLNSYFKQIDESRARAHRLGETGGAQATELSQIDQFISGQKIRIERQRAVIRDLMTEAERRQQLLVEAARERKTLEKLKEKKLEEFKDQRKKSEIKLIDELVVTRFKKEEETR